MIFEPIRQGWLSPIELRDVRLEANMLARGRFEQLDIGDQGAKGRPALHDDEPAT